MQVAQVPASRHVVPGGIYGNTSIKGVGYSIIMHPPCSLYDRAVPFHNYAINALVIFWIQIKRKGYCIREIKRDNSINDGDLFWNQD
jgi:hypothetical protein